MKNLKVGENCVHQEAPSLYMMYAIIHGNVDVLLNGQHQELFSMQNEITTLVSKRKYI